MLAMTSLLESPRLEVPTPVAPAIVTATGLHRSDDIGDAAVHALRGVSLDVHTRRAIIMGPSGSGKSTLMHVLAGLDRPTQGDVWIDGTQIGSLGDKELTSSGAARSASSSSSSTCCRRSAPRRTSPCRCCWPAASQTGRGSTSCSTAVGLGDRRTHRPARALRRPAAASRDRPGSGVQADAHLRRRADGQPRLRAPAREILDLLRESVSSYGQTTVMVTHDPRAATIADRILFLADGRIVNELGRSSSDEVLAALHEVSTP